MSFVECSYWFQSEFEKLGKSKEAETDCECKHRCWSCQNLFHFVGCEMLEKLSGKWCFLMHDGELFFLRFIVLKSKLKLMMCVSFEAKLFHLHLVIHKWKISWHSQPQLGRNLQVAALCKVLVLTMENSLLDGVVNRHYDKLEMTLKTDIDPLRIVLLRKTRCTCWDLQQMSPIERQSIKNLCLILQFPMIFPLEARNVTRRTQVKWLNHFLSETFH